ncbi:hypothetical protein [Limoniibacter endophyticus]|uniref:Uncharacterized protein n=1 Tax=Limoniibacter endophyticus TaxID=1565040 RepID=A0A8J3DN37_9HYPH|nr:hypothetical protein [Limoniibacter endophyticus]GHC66553.1 hypothetical protein GCM10010136_09740 [Limoniibacter endophyticus]
MDVIEKAIRNALEKGDAKDRAYRENVYRSAFSALEKALKANPSTTVESAIKRRKTLQATITEIERQFIVPPPAPDEPEFEQDDRVLDAAPDRDLRLAPEQVKPSRGSAKAPKARREKKRGGSTLATLFTTVILVIIAAFGLWWGVSTGMIGSMTSGTLSSSSRQNVGPRTISEERALAGWTEIFDGSDAEALAATSSGLGQAMQDESGDFLRVTPTATSSTISFPVTQAVLQEVGGGRAMFNIVARSSDGTPTQIAVECDFGDMGNCGRTRYEVPALRGENLFEVDLSQGTASRGEIRIDANVQDDGKAIDIYEIRAMREEE